MQQRDEHQGELFFNELVDALSDVANAFIISRNKDLEAYAPAANVVGGLSMFSFVGSLSAQSWFIRQQEQLLSAEWAAREDVVVGDSPEAYLLRHKHDKAFAAIGASRRRVEMLVALVEDLPSFLFNAALLAEEGPSGCSRESSNENVYAAEDEIGSLSWL